jgi:hypothetical protein
MNMEHTESVTSCMTARARYVVYWDSFSDKVLAFCVVESYPQFSLAWPFN